MGRHLLPRSSAGEIATAVGNYESLFISSFEDLSPHVGGFLQQLIMFVCDASSAACHGLKIRSLLLQSELFAISQLGMRGSISGLLGPNPDNNCTVEFDDFGFSMKDFLTCHILLRCDSSEDLYPVTQPSPIPNALLSVSHSTWHQRLRHHREEVLRSLVSRHFIYCNKEKFPHICHACQLGKHVRLPFSSSDFVVTHSLSLILLYKARLVANGHSQRYVVDCDDTFSPVVKPATIRTVLSLALSRNWHIHQLDVKNAFLNGDLSKNVYMYQPPGFVDPRFPHHVCRLQRSLDGLKHAPRAWFQRFAGYALRVGFSSSRCDSSLFIYISIVLRLHIY
ncbi:ribonuclease H-like domain-containing protein [Tanacetum coccineum]